MYHQTVKEFREMGVCFSRRAITCAQIIRMFLPSNSHKRPVKVTFLQLLICMPKEFWQEKETKGCWAEGEGRREKRP